MAPTKTTRAGSFIKSKKASFTKLLFDPVAPRQPIIDPWLDRGSSALIWGPTGVGKSYFAQTLALMTATGGRLPNLGWSAGGDKPLRVLWFDGEQGIRTAQTRARDMIRFNNEPSPIEVSPTVAEALVTKGVEEFLDYRSKVFGGREYPDLGKDEDRSLLEQVIKEGAFDLVIFDNLMVLSTVESWDGPATRSKSSHLLRQGATQAKRWVGKAGPPPSGGNRPLTDRPNTNNSGQPLPTFLKSCSWVPRSGLATMGTLGTLTNLRLVRPWLNRRSFQLGSATASRLLNTEHLRNSTSDIVVQPLPLLP